MNKNQSSLSTRILDAGLFMHLESYIASQLEIQTRLDMEIATLYREFRAGNLGVQEKNSLHLRIAEAQRLAGLDADAIKDRVIADFEKKIGGTTFGEEISSLDLIHKILIESVSSNIQSIYAMAAQNRVPGQTTDITCELLRYLKD